MTVEAPRPNPADDALLLTVQRACDLTALSVSYGRQLVRSGEWESIRAGRAIRILRSSIEGWIDDKLDN